MARDTFLFGNEDLVAEPVRYAAPQYETSAPKRERKLRHDFNPVGKRRGASLAERIVANPDYLIAGHCGTLNGQEMSFSPEARRSEAYATVKQASAIAAKKIGKHLFKSFSYKRNYDRS